jgi:hypothetical protein
MFSHGVLDPRAFIFPHVDMSALHIRADGLHAEPVAELHAFQTGLESSFNARIATRHRHHSPNLRVNQVFTTCVRTA